MEVHNTLALHVDEQHKNNSMIINRLAKKATDFILICELFHGNSAIVFERAPLTLLTLETFSMKRGKCFLQDSKAVPIVVKVRNHLNAQIKVWLVTLPDPQTGSAL